MLRVSNLAQAPASTIPFTHPLPRLSFEMRHKILSDLNSQGLLMNQADGPEIV
jgi:hypothetical protein